MENLQTKISLFRSLFKGREDVFATRWEKDKKSGYMPAYFFDPYRYRAHKMKGGTFQDYPDKSYLQITDEQMAKLEKSVPVTIAGRNSLTTQFES